jgi:hypothetical protein
VTDVLTGIARGIRNNNPGNIRLSSTQWLGQVPAAQQTDSSFIQFTDPVYGIRAMARVIRSYMARGLTTVPQIIATWAPPPENNTQAYISAVLNEAQLAPDRPILATDIAKIIPAIIRHENGTQPYPLATIVKGVSLS